jgi:hypothetical protein
MVDLTKPLPILILLSAHKWDGHELLYIFAARMLLIHCRLALANDILNEKERASAQLMNTKF